MVPYGSLGREASPVGATQPLIQENLSKGLLLLPYSYFYSKIKNKNGRASEGATNNDPHFLSYN